MGAPGTGGIGDNVLRLSKDHRGIGMLDDAAARVKLQGGDALSHRRALHLIEARA
jgi:hypothetical protein